MSAPLQKKKAFAMLPSVIRPVGELSAREMIAEITLRQKVVYGEDTRRDLFRLPVGRQLDNSRSVAALIRQTELRRAGDQWLIKAPTLAEAEGVCTSEPAEPFYEQPSAAFCTGFLVKGDVVATAGHCVKDSEDAKSIYFVFGYVVPRRGSPVPSLPESDVIPGLSVIDRVEEDKGADWALIRLARLPHRTALIPNLGPPVGPAMPVYVIGCPVGLPLKFADGASVRSAHRPDFFVANLDTYGGNSGSPVFNGVTHEVEGILVRGENDFRDDSARGCRQSLKCPTTGCRGEDVTYISALKKQLAAKGGS